MCGIPYLSTDTNLVLHVWNRDNFVPNDINTFRRFSTKAYFKDLVMPAPQGSLCRYGDPFRGGENPIIRYEVGIGSERLLTDIAPFQQALHPCLPCYGDCSRYNCDTLCNPDKSTAMTFSLHHTNLKSVETLNNQTGNEDNNTLAYYFTGMVENTM